MSTPDRLTPATHFIAPDADGDLTLWRGTREEPAPVAVQRECDTDPAVWAMVVGSMSTPDRLTDEEPHVTLTRDTALALAALGRRAQNDPGQFVKRIHPDDYGDYERLDKWQARALDAAVDSWLAARLAAQPPATDRDALAEQAGATALRDAAEALRDAERQGYVFLDDDERVPWESVARWLENRADALAARPAPDTLADRVQALAEEWERNYSAMLVGGFSACSIGADTAAKRLRALLAGRREPTLADHVQAISDLIDGSYPSDLPAESRLTRRVVKVAEESGEVIEALFGVIGENPRKGVTHTVNNLRAELLDVALAALGAVAHFDPGNPIQHLAEHAEFVHDRLSRALLAGRSDASPEGGA